MKIKAILALILSAVMIFACAACANNTVEPVDNGEDVKATAAEAEATELPIPAETYSTGKFTVAVPEGWSAVPAPDFWDDTQIDEYAVYLVCKEDVTEITDDLLYFDNTPYVKIEYTAPDGLYFEPERAYYSDIEDISYMVDGQEWTGFTGTLTSLTTIIWTQYEDGAYAEANISHFEGDPMSNQDILTILAGISH